MAKVNNGDVHSDWGNYSADHVVILDLHIVRRFRPHLGTSGERNEWKHIFWLDHCGDRLNHRGPRPRLLLRQLRQAGFVDLFANERVPPQPHDRVWLPWENPVPGKDSDETDHLCKTIVDHS